MESFDRSWGRASPDELRKRGLRALGLLCAALLILVAIVAGLGAQNAMLLRERAVSLARDRVEAAHLIARVQRVQTGIRSIVHRLMYRPEELPADNLKNTLAESRLQLTEALAVAKEAGLEREWQAYRAASEHFFEEADRRANLEFPTADDTSVLLRLQEESMEALRDLITASEREAGEAESNLRTQSESLRQRALITFGLLLLLAFTAAIAAFRLVSGLFTQLKENSEEIARVSGYLLERQEAAARRFSHELHDELGQVLTVLKADISSLDPSSNSFGLRKAECLATAAQAIENVRELSQLLHPHILDDFGLVGGLRWLADGFSQRTGIQTNFESNFESRLPDEQRTHLFRIAQEALTNAARHSGAQRIDMRLIQRDSEIILTIADNGKGLQDSPRNSPGIGLVGMRTRAHLAGGSLELESKPAAGLKITVKAPFVAKNEHSHHQNIVSRRPHPSAAGVRPDPVGRGRY